MTNLVYIYQHGLAGSNFYWNRYADYGLTKEELAAVGLKDERVQVSRDLIEPLKAVNQDLEQRGFSLYIKEGYRSPELYQLIYQKRVEKFGREQTDSLLNMQGMPHASGRSVDVALWSKLEDQEVYLRDKADGPEALFADFYKDRTDDKSRQYQELQEWLISVMQKHGFRLGTRREYFHFDYQLVK